MKNIIIILIFALCINLFAQESTTDTTETESDLTVAWIILGGLVVGGTVMYFFYYRPHKIETDSILSQCDNLYLQAKMQYNQEDYTKAVKSFEKFIEYCEMLDTNSYYIKTGRMSRKEKSDFRRNYETAKKMIENSKLKAEQQNLIHINELYAKAQSSYNKQDYQPAKNLYINFLNEYNKLDNYYLKNDTKLLAKIYTAKERIKKIEQGKYDAEIKQPDEISDQKSAQDIKQTAGAGIQHQETEIVVNKYSNGKLKEKYYVIKGIYNEDLKHGLFLGKKWVKL